MVSVKPIILNADNGLMYNNTLYAIANDRNANNNKSQPRNSSASATASASVSATNTTNASSNAADKSKSSNHPTIIYKFFVPRYVDVVGLHFNIMRACNQCQPIVIHVQANALPTPKSFIHTTVIYANKTSENIVDFYPHQNAWHYIEIGFENQQRGSNDSNTDANALVNAFAGLSRAFKSKARLEKKLQFMESNIFVNFSIGLQFINEMPVVESSENGSNEDKSTANVNSNKSDSSSSNNNGNGNTNMDHGTTGSENVNRTVNTSNSNSSSLFDQNANQPTTTVASDVDDLDYTNADENDQRTNEWKTSAKLSAKPRNINYYSLLRQTYREFFMFDYDLLPDENGTIPTFINLTAGIPTGFRFDIGNIFDIGGTLSFAIVMKDNLHEAKLAATASAANTHKSRNRISSDVAVAEKLVHINDELSDAPGHEFAESKTSNGKDMDSMTLDLNQLKDNDDSVANQTIVICIHLGGPGKHVNQFNFSIKY